MIVVAKESCCLLSLLSINSIKWQKNKGSRAIWEVCITPSASEGFSLVKRGSHWRGKTLLNANRVVWLPAGNMVTFPCWTVSVLFVEGGRKRDKESSKVRTSHGKLWFCSSKEKTLSWSPKAKPLPFFMSYYVLLHLFPRSVSYHAFRKTEEFKFQWMVSLVVKMMFGGKDVFLGYLLQGLPCLVPPSLQAYPTDGLFLKHPSFSTLNPERKPGGLPALLCLCLPVREEEREWYNKGINICFHTHAKKKKKGDKWTLVVMSGEHKFSVLLSEGSYFIAIFLLRWTYLVCFLNFTHLFSCGWIIDREHSPTLWILPLVVNKNLRE